MPTRSSKRSAGTATATKSKQTNKRSIEAAEEEDLVLLEEGSEDEYEAKKEYGVRKRATTARAKSSKTTSKGTKQKVTEVEEEEEEEEGEDGVLAPASYDTLTEKTRNKEEKKKSGLAVDDVEELDESGAADEEDDIVLTPPVTLTKVKEEEESLAAISENATLGQKQVCIPPSLFLSRQDSRLRIAISRKFQVDL